MTCNFKGKISPERVLKPFPTISFKYENAQEFGETSLNRYKSSLKMWHEMDEKHDARVLKLHEEIKTEAEQVSCGCKRDSTVFDEDDQVPAYNACMDAQEAEGRRPTPDDYLRWGFDLPEERRRKLNDLHSERECSDPILKRRTQRRSSFRDRE